MSRCKLKYIEHNLTKHTYGSSNNKCPHKVHPHDQITPLSMATAWAIHGMLSPCWNERGDNNAPVPTTNIRFNSPLHNFFMRCPYVTTAEHAQPLAPDCTCCVS